MMYSIIVVLITVIAILITIAILLQSGQGSGLSGGIAGNAGGGGAGAIGSRRTADFLSKATSVLGGSFLMLCLVANFFIDRSTTTSSAVQQRGLQFPVEQGLTDEPTETQSAIPQSAETPQDLQPVEQE